MTIRALIIALTLSILPLLSHSEEFSNEDRHRLHEIQREIDFLSSSTIGDARARQEKIEALIRQQELIYSKYGAQASPRVVIQDQGRPGQRRD